MTLRVLVVHNRYRSAFPSGENQVVDEQVGMLRAEGVDVETYFRSSDEIPTLPLAQQATLPLRLIHSSHDTRRLAAILRSFRPTVVHLHNPYPLISPAVIRTAARAGVPVVQTVHNYRHACVAGTLFRAGSPCTACVTTRLPWPAVAHGCYRGSRAQSLAMTAAEVRHRSTWRLVSRFLPVSPFVAERLVQFGLPADRITVIPNGVPDPGPATSPGTGFLFLGRLDPEKGVRFLLDAWRDAGIDDVSCLTIAGDGPDRQAVEQAVGHYPNVRYLGALPSQEVGRVMAASAVIVMPSLWPEAHGRTVVEAFARGRPVLATNLGGLDGLVDEQVGWVDPPSVHQWAVRLRSLHRSRDTIELKGATARMRYASLYNPSVVLKSLLGIYGSYRAS